MTDKPIVWAFCIGSWPHGDQAWAAVTNDGVVLARHISSNAFWGAHDVEPNRRGEAYLDALGTVDVDYRVMAEDEAPPAYVIERAEARDVADAEATR